MPDEMPQAQPSAAPPPSGPPASGQPSFGSSPVSQPVPNRGHEAAGLSRLGIIVKLMEETIPLLGAGTEPGKDLLKALSALVKHVPAGAVTPGVQQATLEKLIQANKQTGSQVATLRAMQGGGGAPPPQPQAA